MAFVFDKTADNKIWMDASLADRNAGGIVKYIESAAGVLKPSATTWTQHLAASLTFTFDVDVAGLHELYIYCDTKNCEGQIWISLDGSTHFLSNAENRAFGRQFLDRNGMGWVKTDNSAFYLRAGRHTIKIESIHDCVEIQRIVVVPNTDPAPTSVGPASTTSSGGTTIINDESHVDFLNDEDALKYKALLIEMYYEGGSKNFANLPYLSNKNIHYDDLILGNPYIEESLGGSILVGDVDVAIEPDDQKLSDLDFRGHQCIWRRGDVRKPIEDFTTLTINTIESVQLESTNKYSVQLSPTTDIYNTTFYSGADVVREGKMIDELEYILSLFPGASSVANVNVPDNAYSQQVRYKLTEQTTMDELLELICNGFGGVYRTSRSGQLEFVIPDTSSNPALVFSQDIILSDSVREIEVFPAYNRVSVVSKQKYEETSDPTYKITVETEANTGLFDTEITIEVMTLDTLAMSRLSDLYVNRYSRTRTLYSLDVLGIADVCVPAEFCIVQSEIYTGPAITQLIRRTPLTEASSIEVLVTE